MRLSQQAMKIAGRIKRGSRFFILRTAIPDQPGVFVHDFAEVLPGVRAAFFQAFFEQVGAEVVGVDRVFEILIAHHQLGQVKRT